MQQQQISVGDTVRLAIQPSYFKTADPMPMLRPPDLLAIGSEGTVIDRRSINYWVVHFDKGNFLIEAQYLEIIPPRSEP
jgi:hypothetical protein